MPTDSPDSPPERSRFATLRRWFDGHASADLAADAAAPRAANAAGDLDARTRDPSAKAPRRVDWPRIVPFVALHIGALAAFFTEFGWFAFALCCVSYCVRMFGITGFYHRYFSHRAFEVSRPVQFAGAFLGNAAAQRGPLWWAAHHRHHHKHADTDRDLHGPALGFWWSHLGWWTDRSAFATNLRQVPDLARYPELRFLDRFDWFAPLCWAAAIFVLGAVLERYAPGLGTNAWQCLVWGFFVSTVVLYHATFTINSLCHTFGRRRYATRDHSRNNFWLALLTLGEGWHNNHHHYPIAARQGFYWWEVDVTWYSLRALRALGLVRSLRDVPARVREDRRESAALGLGRGEGGQSEQRRVGGSA